MRSRSVLHASTIATGVETGSPASINCCAISTPPVSAHVKHQRIRVHLLANLIGAGARLNVASATLRDTPRSVSERFNEPRSPAPR